MFNLHDKQKKETLKAWLKEKSCAADKIIDCWGPQWNENSDSLVWITLHKQLNQYFWKSCFLYKKFVFPQLECGNQLCSSGVTLWSKCFALHDLMSQHLFHLPHHFNVIQNAKCCMSQMAEIWYSTNSSIKTLVDLNNWLYFMFQWALKANMVSCFISAREQCLPAMGL